MAGSLMRHRVSGKRPETPLKPERVLTEEDRMPWPDWYFDVELRGGSPLGDVSDRTITGRRVDPHAGR